MRPIKEKTKNHKGKKSSKLLQKSRNRLCYIHNVINKEGSNLEETFNNIIRDHKSQTKGVQNIWKLGAKDSCEIYKDRRKRQLQDDDQKEENPNKQKPIIKKKKTVKKRKRRPLKRDNHGRFLRDTSSTKCSCSNCGNSVCSDCF